jgi:phage tail-like protein
MPLESRPSVAATLAKRHAKEYPLPAFYYAVYIADDGKKMESPEKEKKILGISQPFKSQKQPAGLVEASFTEVSGLTQEIQSIDYRDGLDKVTVPRKIPGMSKFSNVTLKRGVFHQRQELQEWFNSKKYNTVDRRTVIVELKDPAGQTLISWTLSNAYPIKIDGPSLKSDGNEIAIESMELVHEGLTVKHENTGE